MLEFLNDLRGTDLPAMLLKVALSIVCGAAIGLERSAKNRPAGFRTHILVCMGAAMAALAGLYLYLDLNLPSDISRISAQVISGLGFIGAGAIIVTKKNTIKGLTTAAGLWTTGIIGLALGSGYYEIGLLGTILVLIAETWLGVLGSKIRPQPEYRLEVFYHEKDSLDHLLRSCKNSHMTIVSLKIHSAPGTSAAGENATAEGMQAISEGDYSEIQDLEETDYTGYVAIVHLRGGVKAADLLVQLHEIPGIESANLL